MHVIAYIREDEAETCDQIIILKCSKNKNNKIILSLKELNKTEKQDTNEDKTDIQGKNTLK